MNFFLNLADVDFDNGFISVTKSYTKRDRRVKGTKSGYWRSVPISSELELILKELKLVSNGNQFILPRIREWGLGLQASS